MTQNSRASRRAAWLARRTLRPFAEILPAGPLQIHTSRALVAAGMLIGCPPPHHVRIDKLGTGTFRGEWVYPPETSESRQVILYVHGSGYAICSARTHRGIVARLAHLTGMPAFTVDYRLAPEHPFPAAADDVEAAYAWLQDIGYRAGNITLVGDSAGGHLILDLLAENVRRSRPQPRSVVMMSPLVDLTLELARRREREVAPDPLISARAARRLVRHYTADHPDDLPRLKLTLDRADDLPRTLIQAGGAEMLVADAEEARRMLVDAGADCTLEIWPGQLHVFQALPALIPEAIPALRTVAAFITEPFATTVTAEKVSAQQKGYATA
ncbi:alpha/beta hydrolase [Gordonia sp. ABSL11-1]|uniref:alpha/beta hydrolase n=1 Tax=Gordonia sp. ABSL11-1 TaxID=3053924 RepID=UPI0025733BFE|nr:alpha/beta hydrolase [Gordonia sp. ABSL11-1]MDL9946925.1 alpha/beta hydrolase [Gordonia sp. ABSL11-1]